MRIRYILLYMLPQIMWWDEFYTLCMRVIFMTAKKLVILLIFFGKTITEEILTVIFIQQVSSSSCSSLPAV